MSKLRVTSQNYPRIEDQEGDFHGFLDPTALEPHIHRIADDDLKRVVIEAIAYAGAKSSRAILELPEGGSGEDIQKILRVKGRELFNYFRKYCGDPASSAYDYKGKHYAAIAKEQFRNRTLQKERMNSGWRYQYIAKEGALLSGRFASVSDIGAAEADFNAVVRRRGSRDTVAIYVSAKNRSNTLGGQDWPKALRALEDVAQGDRNRTCPYLCVFGILMDRGLRYMKHEAKSKRPYSLNTEVWLSDFFWPFFINRSYLEVMMHVLSVLEGIGETSGLDIEIPDELLSAFGDACRETGLIDNAGVFNDADRLVEFFCGRAQ